MLRGVRNTAMAGVFGGMALLTMPVGAKAEEAAANVAYLRQMLAQQNGLKQTGQTGKAAPRAQGS